MDKMKYRTFTFPENPETFGIEAVMEPEYAVAEDGTISYTGMGPLCRIISGSGVFQGADAQQNFNALSVIMATAKVGELVHPVWGTMQACLTELVMKQESRENFVAYSFVFREADESGEIPRLPESKR